MADFEAYRTVLVQGGVASFKSNSFLDNRLIDNSKDRAVIEAGLQTVYAPGPFPSEV
jgi:hypothetical protein